MMMKTQILRSVAVICFVVSTNSIASAGENLNRCFRFWGIGWGDGYHTCSGAGCRPGADLPVASFYEQYGTRPRLFHRQPSQHQVWPAERYYSTGGYSTNAVTYPSEFLGNPPMVQHAPVAQQFAAPTTQLREPEPTTDSEPTLPTPADDDDEEEGLDDSDMDLDSELDLLPDSEEDDLLSPSDQARHGWMKVRMASNRRNVVATPSLTPLPTPMPPARTIQARNLPWLPAAAPKRLPPVR